MVIRLITTTKGISQESSALTFFLKKKLRQRVLSGQAYDSILLAFEGIEIRNVSSSRLDSCMSASFNAVKSEALKKRGVLLEALIVMEIENKIHKFNENEMRIFSIVLASLLQ